MFDPIQNDSQLPESPYPGINPFSYAIRNLFFAREKEARALIRLIVMYRGVLLYSESGAGKSSLINSGLIPLALEEGYQPERVRVQPRKGEEIIVERLSSRVEGKPPFLSSIFAPDGGLERTLLPVEKFLEILRQKAGMIYPLIIFDQFEEWITLFEESSTGQTVEEARASRENIQRAIVSMINDSKLPVKVLISLREDYLAKLTPFFNQCPSLPDQHLRLTTLKSDELYMAIRGPFEKYPGRFRPELSYSLTKEIQKQFEEKMKGGDISLTEVQITCRSLFESGKEGQELEGFFITEGGVRGILEHYLERVLELLGAEEKDTAIALLSHMVTSAGTRNVISEDDLLGRVSSEDDIPREVLSKTLDRLERETKLVQREPRREVYFYEIASEFLVDWIRKKTAFRQHQLEQKKLLEVRRLLEAERQRAEEKTKTARLFKRITFGIILLIVIAVTGGLIWNAIRKEQMITQLRKEAAQAKKEAAQANQALLEGLGGGRAIKEPITAPHNVNEQPELSKGHQEGGE
jgi:hypothetical protein